MPAAARGRKAPELVERQRIRRRLPMRQHRALAATGRARGVEDRGEVVRRARPCLERVGMRCGHLQQRAVARLAQRVQMATLRTLCERLELGTTYRRADDDVRLRIRQEILDLRLLIGRVERQVNAARPAAWRGTASGIPETSPPGPRRARPPAGAARPASWRCVHWRDAGRASCSSARRQFRCTPNRDPRESGARPERRSWSSPD